MLYKSISSEGLGNFTKSKTKPALYHRWWEWSSRQLQFRTVDSTSASGTRLCPNSGKCPGEKEPALKSHRCLSPLFLSDLSKVFDFCEHLSLSFCLNTIPTEEIKMFPGIMKTYTTKTRRQLLVAKMYY